MRKTVCLLIVLIIGMLGFVYLFNGKTTVPRVFQSPYRAQVRAEFETLLAEENRTVLDDTFWTTSVKGTTAQKELEKKAAQLFIKYQMLEKKAKESGVTSVQLDLNTAKWEDVSKQYTTFKQIAIDKMLETVTHAEVEQYYKENSVNYARQATLKGKLAIWKEGIIISQEGLDISEENIRVITETYSGLEPLLKDISIGKQVVWTQNGRYYSFSCEEMEDKGVKPLEEIVDAVATQYAETKVEVWLAENTK